MERSTYDRNGITITYAGPESLIESAPFSRLLNAFTAHLPLRNLHWKPTQCSTSQPATSVGTAGGGPMSPVSPAGQGAPIRTIQTLGAQVEPLSDTLLRTKLKPETRHLIQRSLLERPFCHLYFVIGDDSDAYRTHIRNDIRSWLGTIQGTPTLSAATVTARAFQAAEAAGKSTNGVGTPRSQTPPNRPDTPTRNSTSEDTAPAASSSKDKAPPPSPEYLIVVITPPDGSALAPPSTGAAGRASPMQNGSGSTSALSDSAEKPAPKTGLQRFYSSNSSSSSTSKSGVIEKVRADFNTSRKERVVHLTRLPNLTPSESTPNRAHSDPTIFADLLTRIKECAASTFDAVVSMQGEAVRSELAKKDVPGWNFNKWMAGMECLATTFGSAGLYPDALAQYEEVEAVFMQCMSERKLPYFTHVGGTSTGDDSAPLLDVEKKDYRELILRNEISLFDFRSYLFAKRAHLLGKMGRISQVMSEAPTFLSSISTMLQGETLVKYFIESWTFSSAIDVVEQCQAWLIERGDVRAPGMEDEDMSQGAIRRMADRIADSQLSASFHAAKADLLDLARRQLDKIGIAAGHLPAAAPFSLSVWQASKGRNRDLPPLPVEQEEGHAQKEDSTAAKITRQELLEALENRDVFDLRYVALAERVLAGWISSGRRRNVLRLRFVLGSVDFFRGRYVPAYTAFASMAEPYAEAQWTEIEAIHLARQLACHEKLEKPQDKAWVSVIIALLRTRQSWDTHGATAKIDPSIKWLNEDNLYSLLRTKSKGLEDGIPISGFTSFGVDIKTQTAQIKAEEDEDEFVIAVTVTNGASCPVALDDVRVCLTSGERIDLWFTSGKMTAQPGINPAQLHCATSTIPGRYAVDVSQIRLGKVIFQSLHRQDPKTAASFSVTVSPTFILVPEDGDALDATLEWAPHVLLDRSRTGVLTIATGRNQIDKVELQVMLTSGDKYLRGLSETVFEPPKASQAKMTIQDDTLTMTTLEKQTSYTLLLPFHEVTGIADGTLLVAVNLQFWSAGAREAATRRLRREIRLSLGLPLGVNVQDFFRHDRLLSKFLVSAGTAGPLRLANVDLWSDVDPNESLYLIEAPRQESRSIVSITSPASYAFAIRKKKTNTEQQSSALRLTLVYRTAHEEAAHYLLRALEDVSASRSFISRGLKRCIAKALSRSALTDVDLEAYSDRAQLHFQLFDNRAWTKVCLQWCGSNNANEVVGQIVEVIEQVYAAAETMASRDFTTDLPYEHEDAAFEIAELQAGRRPWRKLSLPVEVPAMTIVNAVTVKLTTENVRVGVPVDAVIEVETSFAWNFHEEQLGQTDAQSDVQANALTVHGTNNEDDEDFEDAHSDLSETPGKQETQKVHQAHTVMYASVDVNCDFITWLLVGTKRTAITLPNPAGHPPPSEETHRNTIMMTLVPLQSGHLPLPTVSIWPLAEPIAQETPPSHAHRRTTDQGNPDTASTPGITQAAVSSDTFITNEAELVHVLPRHTVPPRETFWVAI